MSNTLLLIAKNWPEPNSTAAGRRTLDLLSLFPNQYDIHVASAAEPTPFQENLSALNFQIHTIAVNDDAFDEWIKKLKPAIVIFDRYVMEEQFGWRVEQHAPLALTILDTSDLHCLRSAREQAFKTQQPLNLYNDIAVRELTSIQRCDLTLMISQFETNLLINQFGIAAENVVTLPFITTKKDIPAPVEFEQRQHLIMLGGFKHQPNRDAVRWLKESIWPALKPKLPVGTQIHVYGAYADHAINQLQNKKDQFFIKGRADNALQTMRQYRLNLAPLRFGAGQKGKILEGWLTGTPTITSAIGAESMATDVEIGYPTNQNAEAFAQLAASAYLDKSRWQQLRQNGFKILDASFNRNNFEPSFIDNIETIRDNLEEHRQQNFWARVLKQNQFRASEFMSRWITLKNQSKAGTSSTD